MQKEERRKSQILKVLPKSIVPKMEAFDFTYLQEIRMRAEKPVVLLYKGREVWLSPISQSELREALEYISNYSLYAYEQELRQGFLTIEGGHRVGMAGKIISDGGKVTNLIYISSVNIRVSHEIEGCADCLFPWIVSEGELLHTLLISPPGCGKTTLLRDVIRQISDGNQWVDGVTVGVVDERSELGGCYMGVPQNHLGKRTDILDCCPKAEGMLMLIRSMSPKVVAVDEIGAGEDVQALEYAMYCGCKLLATAHGYSFEEMKKKPLFRNLIAEKRFERYVLIGREPRTGTVKGIYDEQGDLIYSKTERSRYV